LICRADTQFIDEEEIESDGEYSGQDYGRESEESYGETSIESEDKRLRIDIENTDSSSPDEYKNDIAKQETLDAEINISDQTIEELKEENTELP